MCCMQLSPVGCLRALVLLLQGGSVAHIMRYGFPHGLPEPAIATIMKEVGATALRVLQQP